ncbi:MAG: class I SAM-dependent methyltransferase [Myxococcales bacterium]|nr:class I SAM-dependent methyltransferase [Myxococcales bacterium]
MCQKRKTELSTEFAARYETLARVYDPLAALASGGLIGRAKAYHTRFLRSGDRVLYPGVGGGGELPRAARTGARPLGIDASPSMIERARRRATAAELRVGDVWALAAEPASFDAVAAHFFLNLYAEVKMRQALRRLVHWLRPGGCIFVADFAEEGRGAARCLRSAYYAPIAAVGSAIGLADRHPLYDYAAYFREAGVECVARRGFGPPRGPDLYACWVGVRR